MSSYAVADRLAATSGKVGDRAAAIWRAVERGELAAGTAADLVAVWTELATTQAEALALVEYVGAMTELGLAPTAPSVAGRATSVSHLETVARKLVADPETAAMRLEWLARSETARAFQRRTGELMAADDRITGWRRGLNADACELCEWLWQDGRIFPPDTDMHEHKGCQCVQRPTTETPTPTGRRR